MTTGDDTPLPENIGDRLVLMETALAYLVARQSDVEQLSDATDSLATSTAGLETALREVGQIREKQHELSSKVEEVAPKVEELERVAVPRSRLWFTIIFVAALTVAAVLSVLDRQSLHRDVRHNHTRICQLEQQLNEPCK